MQSYADHWRRPRHRPLRPHPLNESVSSKPAKHPGRLQVEEQHQLGHEIDTTFVLYPAFISALR
jgi:hypothetical protein